MPIKLIIADASPAFIYNLKRILASTPEYEILLEFNNGNDLVLSRDLNLADVILIDLHLPKLNGFEAAKRLNFLNSHFQLIAITENKNGTYLEELISAGFKGFVYKPEVATKLFKVINRVLNNEFVFPQNLKT